MARMIPTNERMERARALIQQARDLPAGTDAGWKDFMYVAEVKDLLRQARDLIKFIPYSPSATPESKKEVNKIFEEIEQAEKEILHK